MENNNQNAQQQGNTSDKDVRENPQQGDKWNNYQTKELAGEGNSESAEEAAKVFSQDQE